MFLLQGTSGEETNGRARKENGKVKGKGYRDRTEEGGKKIRDRKNKSYPRTTFFREMAG